MMHNQRGYVLVFTLLVLTVVLVLTTQIFNGGNIYALIAQTNVDREKAKRLALGGVQVAMSQLYTTSGEKAEEEQQKLLAALLPALNRWQNFELTEDRDGIDGQLRICVMCEQGKFNLNKFYDFSKKKFIDEDKPSGGMRALAEEIFRRLKEYTGKDLFPAFEKLLKERGYPFNDVTELFMSPQFIPFKNVVFYEPPTGKEQGARPVYLTDLFTVSTYTEQISPWVFSDSVCAVLGLARARDGEIKKRTELIKNIVKNFKQKMTWRTDWDIFLKPLYDKDFTSLPKHIDSVLASQFEPLTFSVLSYGKVGKITQRVLVIVEKHTKKKGSSASPFIIKRMYWI